MNEITFLQTICEGEHESVEVTQTSTFLNGEVHTYKWNQCKNCGLILLEQNEKRELLSLDEQTDIP